MPPMLRRIVVEGEKCLLVGGDLLDRLGPLHPELLSECLDGLYDLFLVLGTGDLLDGRLRSCVDTFGHRVENVSALLHPVLLRSSLRKDISDGSPEFQSPVSYRELQRLHPTPGYSPEAGPGGLPATKEQAELLFPFVLLALFAGPSVAGIVLTGLVYGRAGFRNLLTRMTRWRIGARWYAVSLLSAPLLVTATLLAPSLSSPEFLPRMLTSDEKAALLLFGIGWGLVGGGLLEELGWTGFAVPTLLRQRHGVLSTGLIVGLLW